MQEVEYKASPSPHVVIKNFLPVPASRDCLAEAQSLQSAFADAQVRGQPEDPECCPECKDKTALIRKGIRQNKVVYMDDYYWERRLESKILQHLELALTDTVFEETFSSFPSLFPIALQTTHMETVLSSYGMCDFYGWHKDAFPLNAAPTTRVITCVLHWNTEPKQYDGGELILTGDTIADQIAYPPVNNTAIFFQSNKCIHAVDATVFEGDFKDSRFSINLWLGFDVRGEFGSSPRGESYPRGMPHKYR
jgi:Rps23 Pro-64 3,4-dihydroxylase Tpa1-like proline 4-hydroxylase